MLDTNSRQRFAGPGQPPAPSAGRVGPLVSVEWLAERLGSDDLVIADCRFVLSDPKAGRRAYQLDHVPGAVFFDLEEDLSAPRANAEHGGPPRGGRHPLPTVEAMAALFGAAGIGDGVTVVCYDDQKGSMAARLWWMLRYLGHEDVALLDGGYSAWRAAGMPVTAEPPSITPRPFVPRPRPAMIATIEEVRALLARGEGVIVDARAPERYRGDVEPLDPVAGHIPGAVNYPWDGNVDDGGTMLSPEELARRFAGLSSGPLVVHCGSGVTGCLNILAMERAGIGGVKLYPGGWSEWCADPANPVARGDESR